MSEMNNGDFQTLKKELEIIKDQQEYHTRLLMGEDGSGVKPLREMVAEMYSAYLRIKWLGGLLGVFGITNLATLAALVNLLLRGGP